MAATAGAKDGSGVGVSAGGGGAGSNPSPALLLSTALASVTVEEGGDETHDGEHSGWLLKAAPKVEDVDKEDSVARRLRRAATALVTVFSRTSDFKRRFFVLDGNELRYYKDEQRKVFSGMIDLSTVLDVRWTDRAGLPLYTFELSTDARVFTLSPSPASEASAREWFQRLQNKLEASRRRGMLAKSLKGSVVTKKARAASARPPWADANGALHGSQFPLYLSHEACRLSTDDLLTTGINLTAAGGAGASSSSLQSLIASSPALSAVLKKVGAPALYAAALAIAQHEVSNNRLNQLIVEAGLTGFGSTSADGGGGGDKGAKGLGRHDAAALASTTATVSVGAFDSAAATTASRLLRRGSMVFAAADYAAKPWVSAPEPNLASMASKRERSATSTGRPVSTALSSGSSTARRPSMVARLIGHASGGSGGGKGGTPTRPIRPSSPGFVVPSPPSPLPGSGVGGSSPVLAASSPSPTGWGRAAFSPSSGQPYLPPPTVGAGGVGPKVRRYRRRMRVVSRWEELSGNMPRWSLSIVDEHRLKHTPMFAPLVGVGPGQAGYMDSLTAYMQVIGDAGEGMAGVFGALAMMASSGGRAKRKAKGGKGGEAHGSDKKGKAKGRGGGGEENDDDDDDDEDEDEDEDEDDEEEEEGEEEETGLQGVPFTDVAGLVPVGVDAGAGAMGLGGQLASGGGGGRVVGRAGKMAHASGGAAPATSERPVSARTLKAAVKSAKAPRASGMGAGVGGRPGAPMSEVMELEMMERLAGGRRTGRELRCRLACMRAGVSIAELSSAPRPAVPATTGASALHAVAVGVGMGSGDQAEGMGGYSALAGARGRERALLSALTHRERGHLAAMRSQAEEYVRLGWDVTVGLPSLPQNTFHATVQSAATGVTMLITPRSRSASIASGGGNQSVAVARRTMTMERRRSQSFEALLSGSLPPSTTGTPAPDTVASTTLEPVRRDSVHSSSRGGKVFTFDTEGSGRASIGGRDVQGGMESVNCPPTRTKSRSLSRRRIGISTSSLNPLPPAPAPTPPSAPAPLMVGGDGDMEGVSDVLRIAMVTAAITTGADAAMLKGAAPPDAAAALLAEYTGLPADPVAPSPGDAADPTTTGHTADVVASLIVHKPAASGPVTPVLSGLPRPLNAFSRPSAPPPHHAVGSGWGGGATPSGAAINLTKRSAMGLARRERMELMQNAYRPGASTVARRGLTAGLAMNPSGGSTPLSPTAAKLQALAVTMVEPVGSGPPAVPPLPSALVAWVTPTLTTMMATTRGAHAHSGEGVDTTGAACHCSAAPSAAAAKVALDAITADCISRRRFVMVSHWHGDVVPVYDDSMAAAVAAEEAGAPACPPWTALHSWDAAGFNVGTSLPRLTPEEGMAGAQPVGTGSAGAGRDGVPSTLGDARPAPILATRTTSSSSATTIDGNAWGEAGVMPAAPLAACLAGLRATVAGWRGGSGGSGEGGPTVTGADWSPPGGVAPLAAAAAAAAPMDGGATANGYDVTLAQRRVLAMLLAAGQLAPVTATAAANLIHAMGTLGQGDLRASEGATVSSIIAKYQPLLSGLNMVGVDSGGAAAAGGAPATRAPTAGGGAAMSALATTLGHEIHVRMVEAVGASKPARPPTMSTTLCTSDATQALRYLMASLMPHVHWSSGSLYGVEVWTSVNGFEDPRFTLGLPRSLPLAPAPIPVTRSDGTPGTGHLLPLTLDPYADVDADAGDGLEAALSFFRMHAVPPGTLLFAAEAPYTRAAALPPYGRKQLLGDRRSLYILVQGRVRVHTTPVMGSEEGETAPAAAVAKPADGQRGWKALKAAVTVSSTLRRLGGGPGGPGAQAAAGAGGSGEGGGGGPGGMVNNTTAGATAALATGGNGLGGLDWGGSDGPAVNLGHAMGMGIGTSAGHDGGERSSYLWVEVNALAAPVVLGVPALVHALPHPSTIITAEPSILLELRPSSYVRLCRAIPLAARGLHMLASMCNPYQIVSCVPCLVAAFADHSTRALAGKERHSLIHNLATIFRPVVLSVGEPLFAEGDYGDAAYVVVQGEVAVSTYSTTTGAHALLAVQRRGGCVGESALILPGPRATRAVALTSAILLRVTHASLRAVLAGRPKVWRAVRNAMVWREGSQLVRLPLLSTLVGGESEAARLAPLTDLFTPIVLAEEPARAWVPETVPTDPMATMAWGNELGVVRTAQRVIVGSGMTSLMIVVQGTASVLPLHVAKTHAHVRHALPASLLTHEADGGGGPPGYAIQSLVPGDWVGGSSLYRPHHDAEHAALVKPGDVTDPAGLTPGDRGAATVLLALDRHHLDVFIATLPAGAKRLRTWRTATAAPGGMSPSTHRTSYVEAGTLAHAAAGAKAKMAGGGGVAAVLTNAGGAGVGVGATGAAPTRTAGHRKSVVSMLGAHTTLLDGEKAPRGAPLPRMDSDDLARVMGQGGTG